MVVLAFGGEAPRELLEALEDYCVEGSQVCFEGQMIVSWSYVVIWSWRPMNAHIATTLPASQQASPAEAEQADAEPPALQSSMRASERACMRACQSALPYGEQEAERPPFLHLIAQVVVVAAEGSPALDECSGAGRSRQQQASLRMSAIAADPRTRAGLRRAAAVAADAVVLAGEAGGHTCDV